MRTLPPQHLRHGDFVDMERQLIAWFRDVIFKPLLEAIRPETEQAAGLARELSNAPDDVLRSALRNGQVQYEAGVFSGSFNRKLANAIRDLGAKFDKRSAVYRMPAAAVPAWVKAEAGAAVQAARDAHRVALEALDSVRFALEGHIQGRPVRAGETVGKINAGFQTAAKALEVMPELSEDALAALSASYTENMKLWIRKFSEEEIGELRERVERNATQGYRFDRLIDSIESRYGVTQSKAKFLARQETGLFMSKFRQERFKEAGVARYRWRTSEDARVRPANNLRGAARAHAGNHRRLNGKIFFYAHPPIVDQDAGRRANPGEDFNCRCVDEPILDPVPIGA